MNEFHNIWKTTHLKRCLTCAPLFWTTAFFNPQLFYQSITDCFHIASFSPYLCAFVPPILSFHWHIHTKLIAYFFEPPWDKQWTNCFYTFRFFFSFFSDISCIHYAYSRFRLYVHITEIKILYKQVSAHNVTYKATIVNLFNEQPHFYTQREICIMSTSQH